MRRLVSVWGTVRFLSAKWKAYTRAYTGQLAWPLILYLRRPLFKSTAMLACQHLARGRLLDIGTGPGRLPLVLANVARDVTCVGIDIEPILLHDAQRNAIRNDVGDRVSFLLADVHGLPFIDKSFDMVISMMSLHLWRDPKQGVAEVFRVLKDGGTATVLVGRRFAYPGKMWLLDFFTRSSAKHIADVFRTSGFHVVQTSYPEVSLLSVTGWK